MHSGHSVRSDDWQLNKSVLETNRHMFEKQLYCDVTFVFKADGKPTENTVSAHRYVLISRSPVFCAMFEGPAKDESGRVEIEDVDKDSFKEMLRFIYCEKVNLSGDNVLTILYCAKKYMILGLKRMCSDFLEHELCHNNVCFILEQASLFVETELQKKCLELIDKRSLDTVQSEGFSGISRKTLESIIKRDTLSLTEMDVYKACIRWAGVECRRQNIETTDQNKRKVLGDVVFLIRFPTMDPDEFIKEVSSMEVLTTEEAFNLILLMKGTAPKIQLNFLATERSGVWNEAFFKSVDAIQSHPYGQDVHPVPFQITYCKKDRAVITSVFMINIHNTNIDTVDIQQTGDYLENLQLATGSVIKLKDRYYLGQQLYEVAFTPAISLASGGKASVVFHHSRDNNYVNLTYIRGQNIIGDPKKARSYATYKQASKKVRNRAAPGFGADQQSQDEIPQDICIVMQSNPWACVVGFRYKVM